VALQLLVIPNSVSKWSISHSPIHIPSIVTPYTRQYDPTAGYCEPICLTNHSRCPCRDLNRASPVQSQESLDQLYGYKFLKKDSYLSRLVGFLYCGGVGKELLNNIKSRDLYILPAFKLFQEVKSSNRNGRSFPIIHLK
jgi:hypothetical protein